MRLIVNTLLQFEKIKDTLSKKPFADKNAFKHFDSFHGWAVARANLDDPDNKAKCVLYTLCRRLAC